MKTKVDKIKEKKEEVLKLNTSTFYGKAEVRLINDVSILDGINKSVVRYDTGKISEGLLHQEEMKRGVEKRPNCSETRKTHFHDNCVGLLYNILRLFYLIDINFDEYDAYATYFQDNALLVINVHLFGDQPFSSLENFVVQPVSVNVICKPELNETFNSNSNYLKVGNTIDEHFLKVIQFSTAGWSHVQPLALAHKSPPLTESLY